MKHRNDFLEYLCLVCLIVRIIDDYYLASKLAEQSLEHIERYARKPVFVRNVQPANFEIKYLVKKLSELLTVKIHSARNVLIRLADLNAILVTIVNQSLFLIIKVVFLFCRFDVSSLLVKIHRFS